MITLKKKYSSLISSDTRYVVCTGGRGSGKSYSINTILCLMMLEENRTILFLRKTLTSAHLSIIPEFIDKIKTLGIEQSFHVTKTEIICTSTGSAIYFRGIQTSSNDNTANLKSIANVSVVVIDEAEELTDETTFDRIDLSVRQKGVVNKVILILNPTTKEHFIYQRFFEQLGVNGGFNGIKDNVTYIHTTYQDNIENLDESFIDQIERMKVINPAKYEHQILGGWLNRAEGVIIENWRTGEYEEHAPSVYGMDFGFSIDPTTLVSTSVDKKLNRLFVKLHLYKPKMTTDDIYRETEKVAPKSLIYADSAEPRLITELKNRKLNIKETVKGQGSITAGIAVLQNFDEIIVDPDSIDLIKELNNYVWHDKKSKVPVDAYNHAIDAIRYAVYPQYAKRKMFVM